MEASNFIYYAPRGLNDKLT